MLFLQFGETILLSYIVSSIIWIENNIFLTISTPSNFDDSSAPESKFHIVTRQPPSDFMFQKIADPAEPFGLHRYPPHHFLLRLRDFPPNIDDLLIVASSASTDVGLFSRSKAPLVTDKPPEKVVGVFTMTAPSDDSRRAQLPLTADLGDTSPIGVALDLSSREQVVKPIPSDELDRSLTPVPAFMVLNNEGILASWWVIYSESIKQGKSYSGLVAVRKDPPSMAPAVTPVNQSFGTSTSKTPFAQAAFGTSVNPTTGFSALTPTTGTTFGTTSPLGTATTAGAFGSTSSLGQKPSPWAGGTSSTAANTSTVFGGPVFGSTTAPKVQGITFGGAASLGIRPSPWSQSSGLGNTASSTFGSVSGAGNSVFGSNSTGIAPSGGFAGFANKNGFAAAAAKGTGESIFSAKAASTSLNSGLEMKNESIFGGLGSKVEDKPSGLFGGRGFKLGSTFKPDGSEKDDAFRPTNSDGSSLFGTGFGTALGEVQKDNVPASQIVNDAEMDADEPDMEQKTENGQIQETNKIGFTPTEAPSSTTPTSTPAGPKFQFPTTTVPPGSPAFGISPPSPTSLTKVDVPKNSVFDFGTEPALPGPSIDSLPVVESHPSAIPQAPSEVPRIKQEPESDGEAEISFQAIPEAPLPPDPTSKASYPVGESSVSSIEPDAPLPPDFLPTEELKKAKEPPPPLPEDKHEKSIESEPAPSSTTIDGPEEEGDSDFGSEDEGDASESGGEEGSGEDVANDLSPSSGSHQTPGFTPQSSFGGAGTVQSNRNDFFTKIARPLQEVNSRSLFGEIASHTAPILPPPKSSSSPRSPSPMRKPLPGRLLRPDASRSVSAPGFASQLLGPKNSSADRQALATRGSPGLTLEQRKVDEQRKLEAQKKKEAEESQALVDKEDESIQKFLQQEIIGTKVLDDFIAHQDYVGNADKDSIPAQVEAVYRDINSMIDTLGINSCSLKGFIKGHEQQSEISRRRVDLEDPEGWCLIEMHSLSTIIEKDLATGLDYGRVKDVASKLEACADLERDLSKLRAKHDDIKTLLASHSDPDYVAIARSQPLSAEQAIQQNDLRRDFTKLQKLLSETEENLTVLRAKLASQATTNGNAASGPTVEAVIRTIKKMTNMAEKRSGDIDVLENQMRKLRLTSRTNSGSSREASPFATPASKTSTRQPGASSTHSQFYTPDSTKDTPRAFRASLTSSTHPYSPRSPSRRKINGIAEEDKERLKSDALRRKEVTQKLRMALQKSSVRVRPMEMD